MQVFGLFRPKGERLALKVERLFMTAEMAFDRGKLETAALALLRLTPVLRDLHYEGWDEAKLDQFLRARGLCKRYVDTDYHKRMRDAVEPVAFNLQLRSGAF